MKWRRMGKGGELVDRRRSGYSRSGGTGMSGLPIPISGRMSLPVLLLVGVVFFFLNGGFGGGGSSSNFDVNNPAQQFPGQAPQAPLGQDSVPGAPPPDEGGQFVAQVTEDIEDFWAQQFQEAGQQYDPIGPSNEPGPVAFTGQTDTGCGVGSSATGPFYCPLDERVYIDLSFFELLRSQFEASGDFAQAYVLAHEVGHHVQHLLGIDRQVREQAQQNPGQRNELSVRQELQADCFAGVWAHSVYERNLLDEGDLEEGLNAAAAIGDDRIQQQTSGRVSPESWTHGSSEQRARWLRRGFDEGRPDVCDTFSGDI